MFPNNSELISAYPLQSKVFGHRFTPNQSLYEYILEFLLVAISRKTVGNNEEEALFPMNPDVYDKEIKYFPEGKVGLKRFIFFNKSKLEGKFEMDTMAYELCVKYLKDRIEIETAREFIDEDYVISLFQNLLYGFNAVIQNRSWFAQSLLPICKEAIFPEMMGMKKDRNGKYDNSFDEEFIDNVDTKFEKNRYNFMARGGEVYYLHVLKALNDYPKYSHEIEQGFNNLLNQFNEFSLLSNFIESVWEEGEGEGFKQPEINKTLGVIPDGFNNREEKTLVELKNILTSTMHPFEKIDILSYGIILQIITMSYQQAKFASGQKLGCWIFDINCNRGTSHPEVKKLAQNAFSKYEEVYLKALYNNVEGNIKEGKGGKLRSEQETIDEAVNNSLKVYRKLGKRIGIIRPVNEKGMRFTLNETILKFLVTSLIAPGTKMTLDRFLYKIHDHFRIVIGQYEYKKEILEGNVETLSDVSFLDKNKEDFHIMLKECGFLRELSDSTSIVENPYKEVTL
ncbi:hypothetical protein JK636_07330 [Clostridium sp. YIM B02515]|uniref:Uncharacterized protein n=1 Tax=Clostridium rhizosphaerae TaxID=2803861 RepID=A0ABS1T8A5_9CLOT|nr:hypothetical protein [Clostridium rhizosphaerae]MBL4935570.1 hypothetical protein [Clostridium rhizosphaerae]